MNPFIQLLFGSVVLACAAFAAGWAACEWTEQEMQKERSHMTVIPPAVQQVP